MRKTLAGLLVKPTVSWYHVHIGKALGMSMPATYRREPHLRLSVLFGGQLLLLQGMDGAIIKAVKG